MARPRLLTIAELGNVEGLEFQKAAAHGDVMVVYCGAGAGRTFRRGLTRLRARLEERPDVVLDVDEKK